MADVGGCSSRRTSGTGCCPVRSADCFRPRWCRPCPWCRRRRLCHRCRWCRHCPWGRPRRFVPPLRVAPPLPLGPSPVPRGGRLPPVGPLGGLLVPPVLPTTTPPAPPGSPPVWIGVQRPPTLVANEPQLG